MKIGIRIYDDRNYFVNEEVLIIPPGAQCLAYHFRDTNAPMRDTHGTVILPRPKVKKWTVEMSPSQTLFKINIKEPLTEEEIKQLMNEFPYTKFRRTSMVEEDA
jgi:hypothetical protein